MLIKLLYNKNLDKKNRFYIDIEKKKNSKNIIQREQNLKIIKPKGKKEKGLREEKKK